jgi:hypothetical protein
LHGYNYVGLLQPFEYVITDFLHLYAYPADILFHLVSAGVDIPIAI